MLLRSVHRAEWEDAIGLGFGGVRRVEEARQKATSGMSNSMALVIAIPLARQQCFVQQRSSQA